VGKRKGEGEWRKGEVCGSTKIRGGVFGAGLESKTERGGPKCGVA
jgi:hypothetical protein